MNYEGLKHLGNSDEEIAGQLSSMLTDLVTFCEDNQNEGQETWATEFKWQCETVKQYVDEDAEGGSNG